MRELNEIEIEAVAGAGVKQAIHKVHVWWDNIDWAGVVDGVRDGINNSADNRNF